MTTDKKEDKKKDKKKNSKKDKKIKSNSNKPFF